MTSASIIAWVIAWEEEREPPRKYEVEGNLFKMAETANLSLRAAAINCNQSTVYNQQFSLHDV